MGSEMCIRDRHQSASKAGYNHRRIACLRRLVNLSSMTETNVENNTDASSNFTRADGRATNELRPVRITRGFTSNPAGSVLVEFGNTPA